MNRQLTNAVMLIATAALTGIGSASAQSMESPMTRLRPIGAPSAVDQYRSTSPQALIAPSGHFQETAYTRATYPGTVTPSPQVSQVQQAAMQFSLPPSTNGVPNTGAPVASPPVASPPTFIPPVASAPVFSTPPPASFNPAPLPPSSLPPQNSFAPQSAGIPRGLPVGPLRSTPVLPNSIPPNAFSQNAISSSSDLAPIAPPQLGSGGFATMYNCSNVSPASGYSAASGIGCGQAVYQQPPTYQAPLNYGPPTSVIAPGGYPTGSVIAVPNAAAAPTGAPIGPLMTFGQSANPVQVGPGLFGQPKAYVPGQGVRNWLRYFTP